MKVLIVGYGEVGKPLFEIVRGVHPDVEWLDVEEKKVQIKPNIMHITFPEDNHQDFVSSAVKYVKEFSPELVLIESSVTPGTTSEIGKRLGNQVLLCHSPVRGNIAEGMKKGLLQYTKYVGPVSPEAGARAGEYYESLGMRTFICSSPIETELGKIFETTYRGLMMTWFQDVHRICERFGCKYDQVVEFIGSTEKEGKQARPVFHPGVVGGHCIVPNAEKLYSIYQSKFVEALLDSNRRRQQELSLKKNQ
jgi:UDP-glucose 6-dehydrogenase